MSEPGRDGPAPDYRHFGRRRGRRLRPGRRRRLETLLPRLGVCVPPPGGILDPRDLFAPGTTETWLEIGFGAGEHLAAMAASHPSVGFIGCEPYVNGVANLLALIEREGLDNVRIFADDALLLLPALAEASLGRVMLLFPDPWPKARHAGRRFVSRATVDRLAALLQGGAELRFASDDAAYVRWTLETVGRHPAFAWTPAGPADWRSRPPDWPPTRYEEKALARGARCTFLRFIRRSPLTAAPG